MEEDGVVKEVSHYHTNSICYINLQFNVPVYHYPVMVRSHVILLGYSIMKISVYSHVILDMN